MMVFVDVSDICLRQEIFCKQIFVVWAESQVFKIVEAVLLVNQQHVFNADAVLSRFIVAGLIGDDHTCLVLGVVVSTDSNGSLVHSLKVTYSMACPMSIVQSLSP